MLSSPHGRPTRSCATKRRKSLTAIGAFVLAYLALLIVVVAPKGAFVVHQVASMSSR